jgi:hypothetical protein
MTEEDEADMRELLGDEAVVKIRAEEAAARAARGSEESER